MFDTQQNEAMNTSIAKYSPKTKTHGMTISLTNRVMIAIGILNLGASLFWINVYSALNISMVPESISSLKSQDQSRVYGKKYEERHDVKLLRMSNYNKKIKDLME